MKPTNSHLESQQTQEAGARIGRPRLIKHINLRRVFDLIRDAGEISRAQLSRATGSSMTTASKTVDRLMALGLIETIGFEPTDARGRPGLIYTVARKSSQIIGIALEPHCCRLVAAGLDGKFSDNPIIQFPTPTTYKALMAELRAEVRKLMATDSRTLYIGMSVPGAVDMAAQKVLISPNMHILDGQSPGIDLQQSVQVKTRLVHETTGTCLAEQIYGAAHGERDFVLIGTYEGFGLSAIVNGELLTGAHGFAGELGHVLLQPDGLLCGCGQRGCLETVSTDQSLLRLAAAKLGKEVTFPDLIAGVRDRSLNLDAEISKTLDYLATGVAAAINIFDPDTLAICSRMFDLKPDVFSDLVKRVASKTLRPVSEHCKIIRVEGDTLGGGVATAVHHIVSSLGPRMNWNDQPA